MLRIRFVAAGAAILFCLGLAAGTAAAQTATDETPGKPLQLLRIVEKPNITSTKHHVKTAAVKSLRTHKVTTHRVAAEKKPHATLVASAAAAPASIAPEGSSATATDAVAEPPAEPSAASGEPAIGELVVGGRAVQVASPGDVNELDLAAATPVTEEKSAPQISMTTSAPVVNKITEPAPKLDQVTATSAEPQTSPVGSASWIMQVLAALGGAVTAGTVAWFLIGSGPQRSYG